jgi:hypothetical protein
MDFHHCDDSPQYVSLICGCAMLIPTGQKRRSSNVVCASLAAALPWRVACSKVASITNPCRVREIATEFTRYYRLE